MSKGMLDPKLAERRTKGADGHTYVQTNSRRADGSLRKAIRVRDGYIPPDQMKKYRSSARGSEESRKYPVGYNPATKKKKKKRSRKKKAAPSESAGAGAAASAPAGAVDAVAVESLAEDMSKKVQIGSTNPADNAKQIKKIKKKIRQIKSLQDKIASGELTSETLSPQQKAKIEKLTGFLEELRALES